MDLREKPVLGRMRSPCRRESVALRCDSLCRHFKRVTFGSPRPTRLTADAEPFGQVGGGDVAIVFATHPRPGLRLFRRKTVSGRPAIRLERGQGLLSSSGELRRAVTGCAVARRESCSNALFHCYNRPAMTPAAKITSARVCLCCNPSRRRDN